MIFVLASLLLLAVLGALCLCRVSGIAGCLDKDENPGKEKKALYREKGTRWGLLLVVWILSLGWIVPAWQFAYFCLEWLEHGLHPFVRDFSTLPLLSTGGRGTIALVWFAIVVAVWSGIGVQVLIQYILTERASTRPARRLSVRHDVRTRVEDEAGWITFGMWVLWILSLGWFLPVWFSVSSYVAWINMHLVFWARGAHSPHSYPTGAVARDSFIVAFVWFAIVFATWSFIGIRIYLRRNSATNSGGEPASATIGTKFGKLKRVKPAATNGE